MQSGETLSSMTDNLVESWKFISDGVRGYLTGGDEHGVELTAGPEEEPVTRRMCFNLEHYLADGEAFGEFVPRHEAAITAERVGSRSVRILIAPTDHWAVHTELTFSVHPDRTIEAEYEFTFDRDYDGFEAFVSNYFHSPEPPFIPLNGEWVQPDVGNSEHRFWTPDAGECYQIRNRYPENPMGLEASFSEASLDHSLMVTPIPESSASVVHAIEQSECATLSANRQYNAHDFSLVGRDVSEGESVTCRAWMSYAELDELHEAFDFYDRLVNT